MSGTKRLSKKAKEPVSKDPFAGHTFDEDENAQDTETKESVIKTKKQDPLKKEGSKLKKMVHGSFKKSSKRKKGGPASEMPLNAVCSAIKKFDDSLRVIIGKGDARAALDSHFEKNLKNYIPQVTDANAWQSADTKMKNRSAFPVYDHSRVKLDAKNDKSSDYINANFVDFDEIDRKYIMTQYPLPETLEDFWSMVFENEVELIISIFNPNGDSDIEEYKVKLENQTVAAEPKKLSSRENSFTMNKSHVEIAGKSKRLPLKDALSYFPLREGEYMTIGKYFVHTRKVESHDLWYRPITYTVEVLPEGCSECKFIRVVNCPKWEKKNIPNTPKTVISLIRAIELDPLRKGPIVIHCDSGIDRSACFLLTDVISKRIFEGKSVDIDEIFKRIRSYRAGTIQSSNLLTYAIYSAVHYIILRGNRRKLLNEATIKILDGLSTDLQKICLTE